MIIQSMFMIIYSFLAPCIYVTAHLTVSSYQHDNFITIFKSDICPDRKETLEMKVKKCIQPTTFKQMKFYSHSPVFPMLSKSSMTLD